MFFLNFFINFWLTSRAKSIDFIFKQEFHCSSAAHIGQPNHLIRPRSENELFFVRSYVCWDLIRFLKMLYHENGYSNPSKKLDGMPSNALVYSFVSSSVGLFYDFFGFIFPNFSKFEQFSNGRTFVYSSVYEFRYT